MSPVSKLCVTCRRQVSNAFNSECDVCNQEGNREVNNTPDDDILINDVNYILPNEYNDLMKNMGLEKK